MHRTPLDDAAVGAITESVGLGIAPQRKALVAASFNQLVLAALAQLDAVDAGEIQPAPAFDPRWQAGQA